MEELTKDPVLEDAAERLGYRAAQSFAFLHDMQLCQRKINQGDDVEFHTEVQRREFQKPENIKHMRALKCLGVDFSKMTGYVAPPVEE